MTSKKYIALAIAFTFVVVSTITGWMLSAIEPDPKPTIELQPFLLHKDCSHD